MFAAVTLADEGALWFAGTSGFEAVRTDQAGSFCDRTIAAGDLFVVEDAAAHPDFKDARFVVGELRMRFYAGIPLMGRNGVVFGTLCVGDQRAARSITPEQFRGLALLAEITIDRLEEHRALIAREAILAKLNAVAGAIEHESELLQLRVQLMADQCQIDALATDAAVQGVRQVLMLDSEIHTALAKTQPNAQLIDSSMISRFDLHAILAAAVEEELDGVLRGAASARSKALALIPPVERLSCLADEICTVLRETPTNGAA